MQIRVRPMVLTLARPFTISRGTRTESPNFLVEVEEDGIIGRGEGHPNPRYHQDQAGAIAALEALPVAPGERPWEMADLLGRFRAQAPEQYAAQCALESALWDWIGRKQQKSVRDLLGLPERGPTISSYTLSMDDEAGLDARLAEAPGWPSYKMKLGGGDEDQRRVEAFRERSDAPFRVDANEAWDEAEAAEKIAWLANLGCELVEQPLPAGSLEAMRRLKKKSKLPLVADEDATNPEGVAALGDAFHGINVKLVKSGGIGAAVRMSHAARKAGLDLMLGCFIESSLGIAAAAQLLPLARWADLDSPCLLKSDPFGPALASPKGLKLPQGPGLGVSDDLPTG